MPVRSATTKVAGSSIAVAPILFMNALISPQVSMRTVNTRHSWVPATRSISAASWSATPVVISAPDRMNTAKTVTTAGFERPLSASSASSTPVNTRLTMTDSATTSTRNRSVANTIRATASVASTIS